MATNNAVKDVRLRMRQAVRQAGFSVKGFSRDHNINESVFYNMGAWPSAFTVLIIARACHVTTDWILTGE